MAELGEREEITGLFTFYAANYPQYELLIDNELAMQKGISVGEALQNLDILIGSTYEQGFIRFGRFFKVYTQAAPEYRRLPSDILQLYVKNDHDEMVLALEQEVEDRRNALSQQAGVHSSRLDAWARGFAFSGTFLGVLAVFSILFAPFDQIGLYFWSLFIPGAVLAMGGSITAAIREALRAVPGERWLRFWDSHPGKALYHLSGIGVERNRPALGGVYRPTELAIGMAADRLYAALPADVREDLGDVPGVVETLEGHAEQMRKRIRHLDSGLSEAAGEDTLGGDLRETRAAAEARLSEVVAALERIRLELLRLHAGAGSVEGLTVDLSHARGLSLDIGHRVEGQRAVAELLDEDADWDTPVPA